VLGAYSIATYKSKTNNGKHQPLKQAKRSYIAALGIADDDNS
jgi:hypothetical protein